MGTEFLTNLTKHIPDPQQGEAEGSDASEVDPDEVEVFDDEDSEE